MEMVTRYAGEAHISAEDWAELNRGIVGAESYAFAEGRAFEAELISNNLLKIYDGCGVMQGREVRIPAGQSEEVTIENGTQGEKRIDLVVERYIKNEDTKVERSKTTMIKGTPVVADPQVPAHIEGNIRDGDMMADWPLYEVELDGINVVEVRPVFKVLMNMSTLKGKVTELIGKITTPTALISRVITVSDRGKRVALTGNLSDYSEIEIRYTFNPYGHFVQSMRMPVKLLDGWSTSPDILNGLFNPNGNGGVIAFVFDDTGITIESETTDANWKIRGIYGWR